MDPPLPTEAEVGGFNNDQNHVNSVNTFVVNSFCLKLGVVNLNSLFNS